MKTLFVVNPCSGRGKIKTELMDIIKIFCDAGYEVTTYVTSCLGDGADIAEKAEAKGYELIVCCGGDGTLNEIITGIMKANSKIPVGYIPAGTTNDFARTHNLPLNLKNSATSITKADCSVNIDIGKFMDKRYFSYIASFGIFTSASYKTQQSVKNTLGHIAYIFEGIANLTNIEDYKISYTADGKKFKGEYIYGGITNSTSVGGIFKYDPEMVDICDGLFEVLMIKKPKNPNDVMKIISGVTSGNFSDNTVFDFCKASKITLKMPDNIVWSLDGEAAKCDRITVIENIPNAITFIK